MKKWEELKVGDIIYFVSLNKNNIKALHGMKIPQVSVISITNTGEHYSIATDKFEVIISYAEYFNRGSDVTYSDDTLENPENWELLIMATTQEGIIHEIKEFFLTKEE